MYKNKQHQPANSKTQAQARALVAISHTCVFFLSRFRKG